MIRFLSIIFLLTLGALNSRGQGITPDSLIFTEAGVSEFTLGDFYILAGSDRLAMAGRALARDQDYAIDYQHNRILLSRPLETGDTLWAFFRRLPLKMAPAVCYLPLATVPDDSQPAAAEPPRPAGAAGLAETGSGVRIGGSKSLSVTLGSGRDLNLEQSLQVSIGGQLTPDIEIDAYLSDQELPLSAGGSTQELSQLDRIYLRASARDWVATLGDYDLSLKRFRLISLERQAKGAMVQGQYRGWQAVGATALAKGRKAVISFSGQDGVQGPYLLPPSSGEPASPILPNSERVWLDGQPMKPGADHDYLIDYPQARLTFTPRRPIDQDSRITVEFEYSQEFYRRTMTAAEVVWRPPAGPWLGLGYFSEGDDSERPLGQPWDETRRQQIAQSGDDSLARWVDGGLPSDSGDYIKRDSIYIYVGKGGDYKVTFTWVGAGAGDYQYRPLLGAYEYAGPGLGDYVAKVRLRPPQRQRMMAVGARWEWRGGGAEIEGDFSDNDLNLMSDLGDGDNRSSAWSYQIDWSRDTLAFGGFSIFSQAMNIPSGFWTGAASVPPDLGGQWGLAGWRDLRLPDPLKGRRSYYHQGECRPARFGRAGGGYGLLRMGDSLSARLVKAWTTVYPWPWLSAAYNYRIVRILGPWLPGGEGQGCRINHTLEKRITLEWLRLELGGSQTDDREPGAMPVERRRQELWSRTEIGPEHRPLGLGYRRQEELSRDRAGSVWQGLWYSDNWQSQLKISPGTWWEAGWEHSTRIKKIRPGFAGVGSRSHLGVMKLGLKPWRQAVVLNADYTLNLTQTQLKAEEYIQVPPGSGQYSYDPATGRFFPDTAGSFIRRVVEQGPASGLTEAGLRLSAMVDPMLYRPSGWWSGWRAEFSGQASISTRRAVDGRMLVFAPSRLWDREGNAASGLDLASDVWYRRDIWSHHLRLRWRRQDDNQFVNRRYTRRRQESLLESSAQHRSDLRSAVRAEAGQEETETAESGRESRGRWLKAGGDVVYRLQRDLDLNPGLEVQRERLERSYYPFSTFMAEFWEYTIQFGIQRFWGPNRSLQAQAATTYRVCDQAQDRLPWELQYTRPLGWAQFWRLQYDYRLGRNLTAGLNYEGRREPAKSVVHNGRFEVRAYF